MTLFKGMLKINIPKYTFHALINTSYFNVSLRSWCSQITNKRAFKGRIKRARFCALKMCFLKRNVLAILLDFLHQLVETKYTLPGLTPTSEIFEASGYFFRKRERMYRERETVLRMDLKKEHRERLNVERDERTYWQKKRVLETHESITSKLRYLKGRKV